MPAKKKAPTGETAKAEAKGPASKKQKVAPPAAPLVPSVPASLAVSSDLEDILGPRWSGLAPLIRAQPEYESFLGPSRSKDILPLRELTFRALAASPPEDFKVVIFGEAPYPRVESATGIALFDGKFRDWQKLGNCASLREMLKSACMWKLKIPRSSNAEAVRTAAKAHGVVDVMEWFQSTLVQGCCWLNTSLTSGGPASKGAHAKFWKPVLRKIVEDLIASKKAGGTGVVFALWGRPSQELKPMLQEVSERAKVTVKFTEAFNPAAAAYGGGADFCETDNFGAINAALTELGHSAIDWLPVRGWETTLGKEPKMSGEVGRMGEFMQETLDLHKLFLDRLGEVSKEGAEKLEAITGIAEQKLVSLAEAVKPIIKLIPEVSKLAKTAMDRVEPAQGLSKDEAGALYLYTMQSAFYRDINAYLRELNRAKILPFYQFLRLFLSALSKLGQAGKPASGELYRGVKLDLKKTYPLNSTVVWWGISSCTPKLSVAQGFMGSSGPRTLFKVESRSSVTIMAFSAFKGEEEVLLGPGTQLRVKAVSTANDLTTIVLCEEGARLVR